MGLFGKLAFWKKNDSFDFESFANKEFSQDPLHKSTPGLDSDPFGGQDPANPAAPSQFSTHNDPFGSTPSPPTHLQSQGFTQGDSRQEMELINSKLDTLKALMNSIDQRLAALERSQKQQPKEPRLW